MRIGIVGDYNPATESHPATTAALFLAARAVGLTPDIEWISTARVTDEALARCDGLWASPGSPYRSADGMLHAIRYAREKKRPLLATCGGFQYTLIEAARNLLGIPNADSAENNTPGATNVIAPVTCAVEQRGAADPKLVGQNKLRVLPDTRLAAIMGEGEHFEGFFCNYEPSAEFLPRFAEAGFTTNSLGANGELRGIELAEHPFFIATLFQPQLTSKRSGRPHPLIRAFAEAVNEFSVNEKKAARKAARKTTS
jgi:CTP synthase (UTP-ammonia lyase)